MRYRPLLSAATPKNGCGASVNAMSRHKIAEKSESGLAPVAAAAGDPCPQDSTVCDPSPRSPLAAYWCPDLGTISRPVLADRTNPAYGTRQPEQNSVYKAALRISTLWSVTAPRPGRARPHATKSRRTSSLQTGKALFIGRLATTVAAARLAMLKRRATDKQYVDLYGSCG